MQLCNNQANPPLVSLQQKLIEHSNSQPERAVYTFINESSEKSLNFKQLLCEVNKIINVLQQQCQPGDRVLIIYKPGFDFISAFLGCLAYGAIAVPLYPPGLNQKSLNGVEHVINDCQPTLILTETDLAERLTTFSKYVKLITTDNLLPMLQTPTNLPPFDPQKIAFIQYTSGSTGTPKGVMISQQNLLTNLQQICQLFQHDSNSIGVIWLPPYHDMGLIGGILQPLYIGFSVILMAPMTFIQKPLRWLEAISRYKATTSGGPNFAYDLCVDRISDEEIAKLDLSHWRVAFNGAEPIAAKTIQAFSEKFAAAGFNQQAFLPCYGMAETTLIISGRQTDRNINVDKDQILERQVVLSSATESQNHVSCGSAVSGVEFEIVDPDKQKLLSADQVGEIWVRGNNVSVGYWGKNELSHQTFQATITDQQSQKTWLRTGDLGFIHQGELYISGRQKDLIIIRGKNYFPQDLEQSFSTSYSDFKTDAAAAFAITVDGEEKLVVMQEIKRTRIKKIDGEAAMEAIRQTISQQHELQAYAILLVKQGAIPKTTSGKVRRFMCRSMYQQKTTNPLFQWQFEQNSQMDLSTILPEEFDGKDSLPMIQHWMRQYLCSSAGFTPDSVDLTLSLTHFGLDSLQVATLASEISNSYQTTISVVQLAEHESIDDLCRYLSVIIDVKNSLKRLLPEQQQNFAQALTEQLQQQQTLPDSVVSEQFYCFEKSAEYADFSKRYDAIEKLEHNPFFPVLDGVNTNLISIQDHEFINYSTNNFLGLSGHPRINQASVNAIQQYGSSVSASRLISGERALHQQLEQKLADFVGCEDALVFVGAATTNVSTVGHLFGEKDLILYDEYSHDSLLQGIKLSHADSQPFAHNSFDDLEKRLIKVRHRYQKVLIFIEGLYSMDGDIPDLPKFIELKKKYHTWLMVDECLSIGVVGATGRGIGEHYDINRQDVDIWMGGISKALASCGGYIAANKLLITYLKYTCPGFIFTTGMSPANTAASLECLKILIEQPEIVQRLRDRVNLFMHLAKEKGFNIGKCDGAAIVPIIIGNSNYCIGIYRGLFQNGINVQPILYPAVAENSARLRFSLNASHSEKQIRYTIDTLFEVYNQLTSNVAIADTCDS